MAYPKQGSRTYSIMKALHEVGPMSYEQIVQRFPTISRKTMGALGSEYKLARVGAQFALSVDLAKWFNGDATAAKALGEIPVTHVARPFKQLSNNWLVSGHPSGRIESRSFVSTATSVPAYRNL